MSEFTLEEVPATTVATLRRTVPVADLPGFFDSAFSHVAGAVADAGGEVGPPPFGWYHGMPTDTVDVSVGFPVVGDVHELGGGVGLHERPAVRAAVGIHVGPYDGLGATYARMQQWVAEQGLAASGEMWEEYLSPPEGDPSTWRTRVVIPVE